jgi:hypothetical protein
MIYTHTTNQTKSLQNEVTRMQETKQKSVHPLNLTLVSQAHGYGPG